MLSCQVITDLVLYCLYLKYISCLNLHTLETDRIVKICIVRISSVPIKKNNE